MHNLSDKLSKKLLRSIAICLTDKFGEAVGYNLKSDLNDSLLNSLWSSLRDKLCDDYDNFKMSSFKGSLRKKTNDEG